MNKTFAEIQELIRSKFSLLELKENTFERSNGQKIFIIEIKKGLRRVCLSSLDMEIKFIENGICWMKGALEKALHGALEKSIIDWLIGSCNSIFFSHYNWLNIYEKRWLIEQSTPLYTRYIWKQNLQKSYSFFNPIFKPFHPIIKLISQDKKLNMLNSGYSMDRIFFRPYIGDTSKLWKNEKKKYSFFEERFEFGYSVYITYNTMSSFKYNLEYDGKVYENISNEQIGSILENVKTKEMYENIKHYAKSGTYLLKDVDDKTIIEGNATEVVGTLSEKYGNEIEQAFYPAGQT